MERMKNCTHCGELKSISAFSKHCHSPDGHAYQCKECNESRAKIWRLTPAGIYSNLKGRINHREKRSLLFTPEAFVTWYVSQDKRCVYCRLTEEEFLNAFQSHYKRHLTRLTIDRKNNELDYTLDNIALACHRCNSIKSDWFTYEEMREIAEKYIIPRIEEWKRNPKV